MHFSDRQDHSVKQEVVEVKPRASEWSRFEIRIETVDLELTAEEKQQIVDGVNHVYEFYDHVLSFDMYRTVPVNILIFKDMVSYRDYLIQRDRGWLVASYGLILASARANLRLSGAVS